MQQELVGSTLIVTMPARLDAVAVAGLEAGLNQIVTQHHGNMLIDMSHVNFVASLALRMLLTNQKKARASGADLRLCALQPQVAEVFRKSRFDTLFTLYPDRDAALAAFH